MPNLSVEDFDRILCNIDMDETQKFFVYMNPFVWNGYWHLKYRNLKHIRKVLKYIGRVFHSKNIYWLGLPIYWVKGLKDFMVEELIYVKNLERN